MELSVAAALKRIGEPFSFEITEKPEPLLYGGREISFLSPLTVKGTYVFDGKAFLLNGSAETVLSSVCARCAAVFPEPYGFPVEERFVKASELSEEEDAYPYMGDRLEIGQAVLDNLYLHLPLVSVCRKDCKGLCPVCGCNRNTVSCNCESAAPDNPFAALFGQHDKE